MSLAPYPSAPYPSLLILRAIVEDLGLSVVTASGDQDAQQKFMDNRSTIDLVITDLKMDNSPAYRPSTSAGSRLIEWLSAEAPTCPIIVFTGNGTLEDMGEKVKRPNVAAYLPKAVELANIERHVLEALRDKDLVVKRRGEWQVLAGTGAPDWTILEPFARANEAENPIHIKGTLQFTGGQIRHRRVETSHGDFIEIDGRDLRDLGPPGSPGLPGLTKRVALLARLYALQATLETTAVDWVEIDLGADCVGLLPVAEPRLEGERARYILNSGTPDAVDQVVLQRESSLLDGVHCATIGLRPFAYDPGTRQLRVLTKARVRISGVRGVALDGPGPTPDPFSPLASQVLNWLGAAAAGDRGRRLDGPSARRSEAADPSADGERPRYLAVGTKEALAAVQPLLDWHQHHGGLDVLPPLVLGEAGLRVPPDALPREVAKLIRAELERRCEEVGSNPHFVLLVGGDATIPFFRYEDGYQGGDPQLRKIPILSDLWYALFDRDSAHPLLCNHQDGTDLNKPVTPDSLSELLALGPTLTTFRGHGLRHCWLLHGPDEGCRTQPRVSWPAAGEDFGVLQGSHGVLSLQQETHLYSDWRGALGSPGQGLGTAIPA